MTQTPMATYFSGSALYGDDFSPAEIEQWFADEAEGYAGLEASYGHAVTEADSYPYHPLNLRHAFRHLPQGRLGHVLGLGSAVGAEFLPIVGRIDQLTIIEPSLQLRADAVGHLTPSYVDPHPSGDLPFDDQTFDVATSFGVLHHIPNVSHVVREISRCLKPGGWFLLREPMISMGDWRQPRPGLTMRERGIPKDLGMGILRDAGFTTVKATPCLFPAATRLGVRWPALGTAHAFGVALDSVLSRAFAWNYRYHATARWQKIRPTSLAVVARRA